MGTGLQRNNGHHILRKLQDKHTSFFYTLFEIRFPAAKKKQYCKLHKKKLLWGEDIHDIHEAQQKKKNEGEKKNLITAIFSHISAG